MVTEFQWQVFEFLNQVCVEVIQVEAFEVLHVTIPTGEEDSVADSSHAVSSHGVFQNRAINPYTIPRTNYILKL